MERLVVLVVLTAVAVVVALVLQRRRPDPPSAPSYRAPRQVDRNDFERPETAVLLAVFTSATCNSCPLAWDAVSTVAGAADERHAQRIDVQEDPGLHQRYKIDGVPTSLVIDQTGVVIQAFFGPVDAASVEAVLPTEGANDDHR